MPTTLTASALLHRYRIVLVAVRTFIGIVYLSNGLAKLLSFHSLTIGPWKTYLIDRTDALAIQRSNTGSAPGFLHDLGNVVVDHWDGMQWLLTGGEVAVGVGLILGLMSQVSAAGGFVLAFSTFVFTLGSGGWTYDYLFEPVILLALVFAPALPGLNSRLRWGRLRGTKDTPAPVRR